MKDRASLHLVKDNAAVVEGVTIQMLVLFHASLNIPAQTSSQNLFAQFHFVFGDGRDLSLFLRVPENQSHIVSFQDEILIERAPEGHSQPSRFSFTSLSNRRREEIEETAA